MTLRFVIAATAVAALLALLPMLGQTAGLAPGGFGLGGLAPRHGF